MVRYAVVLSGGSIGESRNNKTPIFETKEEAQEYGKSYVRSFGGGRRSYYHPRYTVKPISEKLEVKLKEGKLPWWMRV